MVQQLTWYNFLSYNTQFSPVLSAEEDDDDDDDDDTNTRIRVACTKGRRRRAATILRSRRNDIKQVIIHYLKKKVLAVRSTAYSYTFFKKLKKVFF